MVGNQADDILCGDVVGVRWKIMQTVIFVIDARRRGQVIRTGRSRDIATHIREQVSIEQKYREMEEETTEQKEYTPGGTAEWAESYAIPNLAITTNGNALIGNFCPYRTEIHIESVLKLYLVNASAY